MGTINKVFLLGHLGADPEGGLTRNETPWCRFSLATNTKRGDETDTQWHRVAVFGKAAEVALAYLKKGAPVHVEGRIDYRPVEGEDGTTWYTSIITRNLTLLGKKEPDPPENQETDPPF